MQVYSNSWNLNQRVVGASAAPLAAQVLGVTFVALNVLLLLNSLITPAKGKFDVKEV